MENDVPQFKVGDFVEYVRKHLVNNGWRRMTGAIAIVVAVPGTHTGTIGVNWVTLPTPDSYRNDHPNYDNSLRANCFRLFVPSPTESI